MPTVEESKLVEAVYSGTSGGQVYAELPGLGSNTQWPINGIPANHGMAVGTRIIVGFASNGQLWYIGGADIATEQELGAEASARALADLALDGRLTTIESRIRTASFPTPQNSVFLGTVPAGSTGVKLTAEIRVTLTAAAQANLILQPTGGGAMLTSYVIQRGWKNGTAGGMTSDAIGQNNGSLGGFLIGNTEFINTIGHIYALTLDGFLNYSGFVERMWTGRNAGFDRSVDGNRLMNSVYASHDHTGVAVTGLTLFCVGGTMIGKIRQEYIV